MGPNSQLPIVYPFKYTKLILIWSDTLSICVLKFWKAFSKKKIVLEGYQWLKCNLCTIISYIYVTPKDPSLGFLAITLLLRVVFTISRTSNLRECLVHIGCKALSFGYHTDWRYTYNQWSGFSWLDSIGWVFIFDKLHSIGPHVLTIRKALLVTFGFISFLLFRLSIKKMAF